MAISVAIWKVGMQPEQLAAASIGTEADLEAMIVAAPQILSDDWMLIGQQVGTSYRGYLDLLAISRDGSLVVIELKRKMTPREVIAQALDYASWVQELRTDQIAAIYAKFSGGDLAANFLKRFGTALDEETLNQSHQIVIVAETIDESTERIVKYLGDRNIPINVLCFQVFANGAERLLSRAWLLDPVTTQVNAAESPMGDKEPWNGEFYFNFGHGETRSWDEARKYNFISAGGGARYSGPLKLLKAGDRLWVKAPGYGFVGVATVTGELQAASDFTIMNASTNEARPALDVLTEAKYFRDVETDADKCEYFVPVTWIKAVELTAAIHELGFFGVPSTLCRPTSPRWRHTVDRLKAIFNISS
jgi:hypothetical protein